VLGVATMAWLVFAVARLWKATRFA
jgi:hypothetical protein